MRTILALASGAFILVAPVAPVTAAEQGISDALKPPGGSTLIGRFAAAGSQVYVCAPVVGTPEQEAADAGKLAWSFKAPDAVLKSPDGGTILKHDAGPSWEAGDGSRVVGKVIATQDAPAKGAVPWLLLSATETGPGTLAGTRYVQRVDTAGGGKPDGACQPKNAERRVPYTASYLFYR